MREPVRFYAFWPLLAIFLVLSGCYHTRIITGQPESDVVYHKKWVSGFVNGLVIPDWIDVSEVCPNGIARVETRLSFMNIVVTMLTGGIYSPMEVFVACAAPADWTQVLQGRDGAQLVEQAAQIATQTGAPVYIQQLP
ncbi:Bor/Iss family lipoprotein [Rhodothermus profundi]|uniref:Bor protein n=1 Tax=Rhodothermus profundi TaxID=633813 RepID=A0A1M6T184_9BACT|nr:hypothetical protein [Rhodothermus profundi]SHK50762.1 Bor protein [Rhodothermus profundi]